MNRYRSALRLVLVAMMIMVAVGATQASAQRPGTSTAQESYESELTGLEFSWSDDWEYVTVDVTGNDEIVELESEYGPLYVGFAMEEDAETVRDVVLDGFEGAFERSDVLDEGSSRGVAWSLIEGELASGDVVYLYVEVEEDVEEDYDLVAVTVAPEDGFLDQYDLVSSTVELDGDAVFAEFDVEEIEELVGGVATDEDATTAADDQDEDQSETGRSADDTGSGDGYVFETADIEVVVGSDVEINDTQIEDGSYEQVLLVGAGSIGAVSLIESPLDAEATLEGFIEGFMSEMEDSSEIDSGVDGGVAWTVYDATINGMDMYVYATVNEDLYDGHYLELIAAPTDVFEDEFLVFQESVEINGDGMFQDMDIDDLMEIVEGV